MIIRACFIALIVLSFISKGYSFTGEVRMESCYDTVRKGFGFRVINGPIVSRVNCSMFFEPPNGDLFMAVRLNRVSLPKRGNSCPTFTVYSFSSWRQDAVPDRWKGSEVRVPADPSVMMTCNCTTYLERCSNLQFFETNSQNLKIMLTYNPDDVTRTIRRSDAFDVTISSYRRGASTSCPANHFGCWHYRHKCLPDSLRCDGYDNCFDNSDEFDFSCTGRIGGMTLPVFVLMVLGCVLAASLLVWLVVALIRRRRANERLERNEWGEVIKPTMPYGQGGQLQQEQQQFAEPFSADPYNTGSFSQGYEPRM